MSVFVNGTFDILHPGHIGLLSYAYSFSNSIHMAIDSDERIKRLKGDHRPINSAKDRMNILLGIKGVETVDIFNTDAELTYIIKMHKPSIMIVGSDYKGKPVIGSNLVQRVIFYDRITEYSTTDLIERIVKNHGK